MSDFRQVFPAKAGVSPEILEMAEGQTLEHDLAALLVQKSWGVGARNHSSDRSQRDARTSCFRSESLKTPLGDSAQNLVVVAARDQHLDAGNPLGEHGSRGSPPR